jgi:hypothetical protein
MLHSGREHGVHGMGRFGQMVSKMMSAAKRRLFGLTFENMTV